MIDPHVLEMLVCPETRARLSEAAPELVARLNQRIAAGTLKNRAGQPVRQPLDAGLVRPDRDLLYPVVDGIPMMLVDEGIPLDREL